MWRKKKEHFDSAKRAVENLFSDGRGAKTCFEKEPLFYDVTSELEREFGPMGSPGWNAAEERAWERYNAAMLLDARKEAGLTQEELAKRLGVDKGYISRVERGLTEPMVSTFYRLAAALGFRVDLVPVGEAATGATGAAGCPDTPASAEAESLS